MKSAIERLLARAKTGENVSGDPVNESAATFVEEPAPASSEKYIKTPNPSQSGLEIYKDGGMYIPIIGGLVARIEQWRNRR
jgi:hypothetical protein